MVTSRPKKASNRSSGAVSHWVSTADSGAEANQPIQPVPCRMASAPMEGVGAPRAMCVMPSTPRLRQVSPIAIRPVSSTLSCGWRMTRNASPNSTSGITQARQPIAPTKNA